MSSAPSFVLCRCSINYLKATGACLSRLLSSASSLEMKMPPKFQSASSVLTIAKRPSGAAPKAPLPEFSGFIPVDRLDIKYSRSSGPGGQHVNRTNTKVEIRFNVEQADWLPDWIRQRLAIRERTRMTNDGSVIVTSDKTRKQMLNQADCIDKIRRMILEASRLPKEPTPEEIAIRERRRRQAEKRRVADRRHHSMIKQGRSAPPASDD